MSNRIWYQKSSRQNKIDWLLKNQNLWEGWADCFDPRKRSIVEKMREEGLISDKTYWPDDSLTSLINEARKKRREK